VIEGMEKAKEQGGTRIVGYEANGGFLTATDIVRGDHVLKALPTRDAIILIVSVLLLAAERGVMLSNLAAVLPSRFTFSNRLKDFPSEKSLAWLGELDSGDEERDREAIGSFFGEYFGEIDSIDRTDGLRITFQSGDIIHMRPSGNAPEFRCYTEAESESRAKEINRKCMEIMETA
jgi:phosphomannomutase